MRGTVRTVVVAATVGALALAASAFGQVGTPPAEQKRRPDVQNRAEAAGHRDACGKPGGFPREFRRVVHAETKVQVRDGFAVHTADRGTIARIDAGSRRLTIERADGERVTIQASDETRICRDGKPATFGELEAGDHAGIMQVTHGDRTVVRAIRAFSPEFVEQAERDRAGEKERRRTEMERRKGQAPGGSGG